MLIAGKNSALIDMRLRSAPPGQPVRPAQRVRSRPILLPRAAGAAALLPPAGAGQRQLPGLPGCVEEIYKIRHHSLFAPKDFDVSPYFSIVKPLQAVEFDFHRIAWEPQP